MDDLESNRKPAVTPRTHFPKTLGVVFLAFLAVPVALPKKAKEKSRLNLVNTVYVTGIGGAAYYVRENLSDQTCLARTAKADDADAILEVWEGITPCQVTLSKMCQGVSATVTDRQTGKVIWYRTDNEISTPGVGGPEAAGKWILWQLNSSACNGRKSKAPNSSP